MKNIIEVYKNNGTLYGHKLSDEAMKYGRVDYATLAHIIGDAVLCCGIIRNTYEVGEWASSYGTPSPSD